LIYQSNMEMNLPTAGEGSFPDDDGPAHLNVVVNDLAVAVFRH
jgi:hypothetical protein